VIPLIVKYFHSTDERANERVLKIG